MTRAETENHLKYVYGRFDEPRFPPVSYRLPFTMYGQPLSTGLHVLITKGALFNQTDWPRH